MPRHALLVAKLATRRVVDPSDGVAVGPGPLLSIPRVRAHAPVAGIDLWPRFPTARGLLAAIGSDLLVAVAVGQRFTDRDESIVTLE